MIKKLLFVGTILLVVVCVAMAADAITGKWTMSQEGRNGGPARVTTFVLKVDGTSLTGSVLAPAGGRGMGGGGGAAPGGAAPAPQEMAIKNGKVSGNTITFETTRTGQNGEQVTKYEGTVSGDDLNLKVTRTGQDGTPMTTESVAKRAIT